MQPNPMEIEYYEVKYHFDQKVSIYENSHANQVIVKSLVIRNSRQVKFNWSLAETENDDSCSQIQADVAIKKYL